MLKVKFTVQMKKGMQLMRKRGKNMDKIIEVIDLLASGHTLLAKYQDHALKGDMKNARECHIEPDWLLIYQVFDGTLILSCTATGTHDDLFKK